MACRYIPVSERVCVAISLRDDIPCFKRQPIYDYMCPMDELPQNIAKDFVGPPDLGSAFEFCQALESRLQKSDKTMAILTSQLKEHQEKTFFLLGAYLVMKLEKNLESTLQSLEPTMAKYLHHWNPPNNNMAGVHLCLKDYLGALYRAKQIGWVEFGNKPTSFEIDEYRHLDSPLNADLHEIIAGKLIMMRGPRDLPGGVLWQDVATEDGRFVRREFSPAHYADILEQLDVQAVMRCSVPAYNREEFEAAGIAVVDLCCEDGAPPPIEVVSKFLAVVERLPGAVAVHCGSGPGPSGTLVGLYLMKHHGFTAREAMGWLRIVRPGW